MEKNPQYRIIAVAIVAIVVAYFAGINKSTSIAGDSVDSSVAPIQNGGLTQDQLFTKKAECSKYTQQLRDNLEQDQWTIEALYQVFYSPVKNTCLSAKYVLYPAHSTVQGGEILRIDDILTGENVWLQNYTPEMKYWEAEGILDEQIAKLK